jgi:myo-inositol-1(or 4)-monophosphatase
MLFLNYAVSKSYVLGICGVLIVLYSLIMTISVSAMGLTIETGVLLFYVTILIAHFLPWSFGQDHQYTFYRLLRTVIFPGHTITFSEVLLADALCSISKLLKDFGTTVVVIYATLRHEDAIVYHNSAMILVAVFASIPFWIRVRQCMIQLDSCPDSIAKIPVMLNILKYMSSFPPIWLTAAASLGYMHPHMPQFITTAAVINSLYSFLWDVIMDWGLLTFTRDGRVLRRQRLHLPLFTYFFLVIINFVLRFSWFVNRLPGFDHLHSSIIVLVIEVGEVFRRAMWNIYRIEWEVISQQEKALEKEKSLSSGSLSTLTSPNSAPNGNSNNNSVAIRSPSTINFSATD